MSTIINDTVKKNEQIKNKSEKVTEFYDHLRIYLEKDKYNLFKTKVKFNIGSKIKLSNFQIQKLIDFKIKIKNAVDNLLDVRKLSKEMNSKIKEELIKKLRLNDENWIN